MALGGFSGSDPILTTSQLAALVKSGEVRYFLLNGSGNGGPGGSGQSNLITWITQHSKAISSSNGNLVQRVALPMALAALNSCTK